MNQVTTGEAFITAFVRENKDKIHRILSDDDLDIVEKTTLLRRMAREIADKYGPSMQYRDLEDFESHYDRGETPLTKLEGDGFRVGELFVLKKCPMVPVFGEFKNNGEFPPYWSSPGMEFCTGFCGDVVSRVPCVRMGFVPDRSALEFVRDL